ncbi:molybdopterin synthase [Haloarchaeobius sp. DFWS5]|uniref:molybdopterin synthase n=1 Tax=Haloarchaeobius sp. DFWS5 TaxID=3446114 RepID=UPI003EC0AE73
MYVVGVAGPADAGRRTLASQVVSHLAETGRVATVEEHDDSASTAADRGGAGVHYALGDSSWSATGDERTLSETLSDLAPAYDYCVLDGFADAVVPQIRLGEDALTDETGTSTEADSDRLLATAARAEDVDVPTVCEELTATDPYECLDSLVAQVKRSADAEKAGAIATFTGRVRAKEDDEDDFTESLTFEKYEGVAADRMRVIERELEARDGVFEVVMHHRTGVIPYGEDIVFVVVLAGHRGEAFETVEDGINRLKDEVPIFKKERTTEESFWVHDRR